MSIQDFESEAPLYAAHYRDFAKQWHYSMEFWPCRDPTFVGGNINSPAGSEDSYYFEEPANTFYPPGVICAREEYLHMCPTSGESGSTLMASDDAKEGQWKRIRTEGILSFIKGCTAFAFGRFVDFFCNRYLYI